MQIGIIGLGNMGSGMAANLQAFSASQNQSLWVFDLDSEKSRHKPLVAHRRLTRSKSWLES